MWMWLNELTTFEWKGLCAMEISPTIASGHLLD
jgi:hypothetical protein